MFVKKLHVRNLHAYFNLEYLNTLGKKVRDVDLFIDSYSEIFFMYNYLLSELVRIMPTQCDVTFQYTVSFSV